MYKKIIYDIIFTVLSCRIFETPFHYPKIVNFIMFIHTFDFLFPTKKLHTLWMTSHTTVTTNKLFNMPTLGKNIFILQKFSCQEYSFLAVVFFSCTSACHFVHCSNHLRNKWISSKHCKTFSNAVTFISAYMFHWWYSWCKCFNDLVCLTTSPVHMSCLRFLL